MKETKYSPYATNKGGKIDAPRKQNNSEPKATKTVGNDLRNKRG